MKKILLALLPLLAFADDEALIESLLAQMTLEEKVAMCHGDSYWTAPGVERLGIPKLTLTDGPHGIRQEIDAHSFRVLTRDDDLSDASTALPVGSALACTWHPRLAVEFGSLLGREARRRGKDVVLGPSIEIIRNPLNGRNFEYMSEDPLLTSRFCAPYISGVRSAGVAPCAKHFVLNNQEQNRDHYNAVVSPRALREIYLPAFQVAIDAGVMCVMGAYNRVAGQQMCHNATMVNDLLKGEMGFTGVYLSDWGGTHSTDEAARNGLDLEMGTRTEKYADYFLADAFLEGLKNGTYPVALVDDKVRRLLRLRASLKRDATPAQRNTAGHSEIAREIAREAVVLLKNDNQLLPLQRDALHNVLVLGANAHAQHNRGGGSSEVKSVYEITPYAGLTNAIGAAWRGRPPPPPRQEGEAIGGDVILSADNAGVRGWTAQYFANDKWEGEPAFTRTDPAIDFDWQHGSPGEGVPEDFFSVRWSAQIKAPASGVYKLLLGVDDDGAIYLDGKNVLSSKFNMVPSVADVELEAGRVYDLRVDFREEKGGARIRVGWQRPDAPRPAALEEALAQAKAASAVVFFTGLNKTIETEGHDRVSLKLPSAEEDFLKEILAVRPDTIVVVISGAPVEMPWASEAQAIVYSSYLGQEAGHALAGVLLGEVNPSGHLAVTWPVSLDDTPIKKLPDAYGWETSVMAEDIFVGHRWYDQHHIEPLWPFGHGLSYTTFEYSDLAVTERDGKYGVSCVVKNTGDRAGQTVAQLYVGVTDAPMPQPPRVLKDFAKVLLSPGESQTLRFSFDMPYYDEATMKWKKFSPPFRVSVGTSSRDLRVTTTVE